MAKKTIKILRRTVIHGVGPVDVGSVHRVSETDALTLIHLKKAVEVDPQKEKAPAPKTTKEEAQEAQEEQSTEKPKKRGKGRPKKK